MTRYDTLSDELRHLVDTYLECDSIVSECAKTLDLSELQVWAKLQRRDVVLALSEKSLPVDPNGSVQEAMQVLVRGYRGDGVSKDMRECAKLYLQANGKLNPKTSEVSVDLKKMLLSLEHKEEVSR